MTTTTATTDIGARYVAFWNATPDEQRRTGPDLFASDVAYVAPVGVRNGVEELAEFTEQFRAGVGDYRFAARSEPDAHHDRVRIAWQILRGGATFAEGTDVLEVAGDGRIAAVAAFIDRAPDGFDPHAHH